LTTYFNHLINLTTLNYYQQINMLDWHPSKWSDCWMQREGNNQNCTEREPLGI